MPSRGLTFNDWCDKNSKKRFRAWNGQVYMAGTGYLEVLCEIEMLK